MKIPFAAVAVVVLLAGCSSSGGGQITHTVFPDPPSESSGTSYATTADAVAASCAAFDHFMEVLYQETPRGDLTVLNEAAGPVLSDLLHTDAPLDDSAQQLLTDAGDMVAHVGSAGFHDTGRPDDPEFAAVAADCPTP